jgi:hypothetical protein
LVKIFEVFVIFLSYIYKAKVVKTLTFLPKIFLSTTTLASCTPKLFILKGYEKSIMQLLPQIRSLLPTCAPTNVILSIALLLFYSLIINPYVFFQN